MPFVAHPCTPHDIISVVGHTPAILCPNLVLIRPTVTEIQPFLFPTPCCCSCSNSLSLCLPLLFHLLHQIPPPMAYQAPVPVPVPTYNWVASDQMWEFCLFKCQLETWTRICKIKAKEKLDYLLCILGKEGYAAMDRWIPADEAHKNDPTKFLDCIESTLDDKISPRVCVWARRHQKEVWQIHRWASRSDMPTCLQGSNWWWQWCRSRIWSSMQADSDDPRCWHWAAQTTSEGQLWQEGITPARDL